MKNVIKNSLKELGFKKNEILVYLTLTQLGEARASEIAKKAGLPRTTVIGILNKLKEENFLTIHKYKGVYYYWIESPEVIANIFKYRLSIAEKLNESLSSFYRSDSGFPVSRAYDTKQNIKNFIEKLLANTPKKSTIYTFDSPGMGNYSKIITEKSEDNLNDLKKKRQIFTKSLVPFSKLDKILKLKINPEVIEIRELPEGINFYASIWIIKDTLVHFSGFPPFAVEVKHKNIVDSNMALFNYFWEKGG